MEAIATSNKEASSNGFLIFSPSACGAASVYRRGEASNLIGMASNLLAVSNNLQPIGQNISLVLRHNVTSIASAQLGQLAVFPISSLMDAR